MINSIPKSTKQESYADTVSKELLHAYIETSRVYPTFVLQHS